MNDCLLNYINGQFVKSEGKECLMVKNPSNDETIGKVPVGTSVDVNRAVDAAKEAFLSWRKTSPLERSRYFFKIKMLFEEHFEEISLLLSKEMGKTLAEARGDFRRGIENIEVAAGIPTLMMGEALEDVASDIDCFTVRRPMGVFAAITPFNFPAMVPLWFWPFAVATGNTFILKPSEQVPLTQQRLFELIDKAGLPKGIINMVHGTKEVVLSLCEHPDIKGVSFVGSSQVAKIVYEKSSQTGKRVQSLGGAKNYMVVMPDAEREKTLSTITDSSFGCAGQRCLAASTVLMVGKETEEWFKKGYLENVRKIKTGNALDPTVTLGPVISKASKERILKHIELAVKEGGELLLDGRNTADLGPGYFLRPTIVDKVTKDMTMFREELFGPVVGLMMVRDLDEAISIINSSVYANTTSIFTASGKSARYFQYRVDPSMIGVNIGVPAPMSFFSFGGTKNSFFGDLKAHGKKSIEFYTDTKVSIVRWF